MLDEGDSCWLVKEGRLNAADEGEEAVQCEKAI
jgi:hypothetical protein